MNLSVKQRQIMNTVVRANPDGSFLDVDQLLENLPYRTTKASMHFSIRALEKHKLVVKKGLEKRRARNRMIIAPTIKGLESVRVP